MVKINRNLNFVLDVRREAFDDEGKEVSETVAQVFSVPILKETFDQYYMVIMKVFSTIYSQGIVGTGAGRVAYLVMKEEAQKLKMWEGPAGVERGLVGEIRRMTTVLLPGETEGWQTMTLYEAEKHEHLEAEEVDEIINTLIFFTVLYWGHTRKDRAPILKSLCSIWAAQISPLSLTDYMLSLPMLTKEDSSGTTEEATPAAPPVTAPETPFVPS